MQHATYLHVCESMSVLLSVSSFQRISVTLDFIFFLFIWFDLDGGKLTNVTRPSKIRFQFVTRCRPISALSVALFVQPLDDSVLDSLSLSLSHYLVLFLYLNAVLIFFLRPAGLFALADDFDYRRRGFRRQESAAIVGHFFSTVDVFLFFLSITASHRNRNRCRVYSLEPIWLTFRLFFLRWVSICWCSTSIVGRIIRFVIRKTNPSFLVNWCYDSIGRLMNGHPRHHLI